MSDPLFAMMIRRKTLLLVFLGLALIVALLGQWLIPKSYSVSNCIRLGRFMGVPLELPEFTKQRFKMVGFVADAYDAAGMKLKTVVDDLPRSIKINIENDLNKTNGLDTLIFSTRGSSPEEARQMSEALANHLIAIHGDKLKRAITLRDKEVVDWRNSIEQTRKEIDAMGAQLDNLDGTTVNQTAVFLMSAKLDERRNILFNMMQMYHNVVLKSGNPVESFNTEVASPPRTPEKASFPKLSLLLPALWAAAFLAWLCLCWYENMRNDLNDNKRAGA